MRRGPPMRILPAKRRLVLFEYARPIKILITLMRLARSHVDSSITLAAAPALYFLDQPACQPSAGIADRLRDVVIRIAMNDHRPVKNAVFAMIHPNRVHVE